MNTDTALDTWRIWQQSQGLSERTIAERISTIRQLLRHSERGPLELVPFDIIRFSARPGLLPASKATYHASIRAYCAWLIAAELRDDDPSKKTPRPKRPKAQPRPVADDQLERLLRAANRRRTKTYILLAVLAGLRVHEIAKIRGEDIAGGVLTVVGKGGKTALIPLHETLIEEASNYPSDGFWFPAYPSQTAATHIRANSVSKAIHDAMLRAGFPGKPHQLRHYYGTTLLRNGADLRVVQTLMRHESPATTAIYTKVDIGQQVAAIRTLRLPESDQLAA